jgi:hypothetical protein
MPLYDEDGTVLWPELMDRLDSIPRNGTPIFATAWQPSALQPVLILTPSSWACDTAAAPKAVTLI